MSTVTPKSDNIVLVLLLLLLLLLLHTKFGVCSSIRSKVVDGLPVFKNRSLDPDRVHFKGLFVIRWQIGVVFNMHTKYDVYL